MDIQDCSKAMAKNLRTKTEELRREHILEAAIEAFACHGFRGATVRDIATDAGVSDGTVYNSFENKEALLMEVLQRLLMTSRPSASSVSTDENASSDLGQMLRTRWDGLTDETLAMMRIVWSEALINRELGRRYMNDFVQPLMRISASPAFEEQLAANTIKAEDVQVVSRLIVGSFLGLVLLRILGDEMLNEQPAAFAQPLSEMLLRGIFSEEASNRKA